MSIVLVRYEGAVVGRVITNHSMTVAEAADLAGIDIDEMVDADTPMFDPAKFDIEYISEAEHARTLDDEEFAEALGFASYEALVAASEHVRSQGDVDLWVTCLPGDRWAAWDDAELSLDRVAFFASRRDALAYHDVREE